MFFVTLECVIVVSYVLMYLPIKDYRPYAVGSNLVEKMNDGVKGEYESMFVYKNKETGELKEMTQDEYMASNIWTDKSWEYKDRTQKTIVEAVNPTIMDFKPMISVTDMSDLERNVPMVQSILDTSMVELLKIYDLGYESYMEIPFEEYTVEDFPAEEYRIDDTVRNINPELSDIEIDKGILEQDQIVLLISRKLEKADWVTIDKMKEIFKACKKKGTPFVMICNGTRDQINAFRKEHNFEVPIFVMDEIELKIVSRSNPSLLVLEKGIVKAKYPYRSIPEKNAFKNEFLK